MLRSVAVLVQAPVSPFEFGVLTEVFGIDRSAEGVPRFDFRVCGPSGTGAVDTAVPGLALVGMQSMAAAATADLVAVPSSPLGGSAHPEVVTAVREAHARGAYVLSLCSGTFALAEAGLLAGRRAATHWRYAAELQDAFPDVLVDDAVLYAHDGTVVTGAGTAAGIDACLHLVRLEHGSAVAAAIARRMVVPPHRDGGQRQFIDRPVPESGAGLQSLREYLLHHLEGTHDVASMARHAAVSERTLARRFVAETGVTPHAWLTLQRVLAARRLLEATDLPLDAVAHRVGLGDAALLRHHLRRATGLTPAAYRRSFAQRAAGGS